MENQGRQQQPLLATSPTTLVPPFPPNVERRPLEIRAKDAIVVSLTLLLLACSIALFYKHWKKNYHDINQLPYYAYLYTKAESKPEEEPVNILTNHANIAEKLESENSAVVDRSTLTTDKERRIGSLKLGLAKNDLGQLRRTQSTRTQCRLSNLVDVAAASRLGNMSAFRGSLVSLSGESSGSASALFPIAKAAVVASRGRLPSHLVTRRVPQRAASDVHARVNSLRMQLTMRRIQSGHQLVEEASGQEENHEEHEALLGEMPEENMIGESCTAICGKTTTLLAKDDSTLITVAPTPFNSAASTSTVTVATMSTTVDEAFPSAKIVTAV